MYGCLISLYSLASCNLYMSELRIYKGSEFSLIFHIILCFQVLSTCRVVHAPTDRKYRHLRQYSPQAQCWLWLRRQCAVEMFGLRRTFKKHPSLWGRIMKREKSAEAVAVEGNWLGIHEGQLTHCCYS